ncbi:GntR family transcriptional regulator [uncultured Tateyamaria sp.]|uniref:GntR family transcriptional regulator n=1 Tax=uncultured Tateyamaria sp. TaxID=455651 RepID=UPI002624EDBB|nr:GntR family transcriptional regulator [uncultured Tateyamaria sp.]
MNATTECAYFHAYSMIQRNIVYYRYGPGDRLNICELAKELNMSPTPVREALARLSIEGFIDCRSQRGFFVKPITRDDMHEMLGLLQLYTGHLYREICANGKIRALSQAIRTTFDRDCSVEVAREINTLRDLIGNLSNMPNTDRHYGQLVQRTQVLRAIEFKDPDRMLWLSKLAMDAAENGDAEKEDAFLDCVDTFYQVRFNWLDTVVSQANSVVSNVHRSPNTRVSR